MLTCVFWLCSLAVLSSVSATVDPYNTTVLSVYGAIYPDKPHYYNYNVTHTYFRDAILARGARFNGYKCFLPAGLTIDYWINESELPVSVSYVNLYRQRRVYSKKAIKLSAIRNVMNVLRNELQLPLREISRNQYYRNMHTLFARSRESGAMSQTEDAYVNTEDAQLESSQKPQQQAADAVPVREDIRDQLPSLSDYDDDHDGDTNNNHASSDEASLNGSLAVLDIDAAENYYQPTDTVVVTSAAAAAAATADDPTNITVINEDSVERGSDSGDLDSTRGFSFQQRYRRPDPLIPIQIHFRKKPYPQSNFWQFITNNETSWRSYYIGVYPLYAGETDDLLYRFRHNFRHSLGLGHLDDTRSIMHPTNTLRNPMYRIDTKAVHQLLCSTRNAPRPRNQR